MCAVICKADSCTPAELQAQRTAVREALDQRGPALYRSDGAGAGSGLLRGEPASCRARRHACKEAQALSSRPRLRLH